MKTEKEIENESKNFEYNFIQRISWLLCTEKIKMLENLKSIAKRNKYTMNKNLTDFKNDLYIFDRIDKNKDYYIIRLRLEISIVDDEFFKFALLDYEEFSDIFSKNKLKDIA